MGTSDDDTWVVDEAWYTRAGNSRALDRAFRRGRHPRFPPDLSGEDYRRLLLEHIDTLGNADTTDDERAETAQWRQAVSEAPADELQAECSPSPGRHRRRR